MTAANMAYVSRCLCGCGGLIAAIVDNPSHKKKTANEIYALILDGYTIERATVEEVRGMAFGCQTEKMQIELPI